MLPEFEGLGRRINQARRRLIRKRWKRARWRSSVADHQPSSALARRRLARRWKPSSPLCRAGAAVLARFEDEGADASEVHLHGQDLVHQADTAHHTAFGLRDLRGLPRWIAKYGYAPHLEVVSPRPRVR
jgi:hypothetical protein